MYSVSSHGLACNINFCGHKLPPATRHLAPVGDCSAVYSGDLQPSCGDSHAAREGRPHRLEVLGCDRGEVDTGVIHRDT